MVVSFVTFRLNRPYSRLFMLQLLAALLGLAIPSTAVALQSSGPQAVYFGTTGHHLDNRYGFLDYWKANGQVLRIGYPITAGHPLG